MTQHDAASFAALVDRQLEAAGDGLDALLALPPGAGADNAVVVACDNDLVSVRRPRLVARSHGASERRSWGRHRRRRELVSATCPRLAPCLGAVHKQ